MQYLAYSSAVQFAWLRHGASATSLSRLLKEARSPNTSDLYQEPPGNFHDTYSPDMCDAGVDVYGHGRSIVRPSAASLHLGCKWTPSHTCAGKSPVVGDSRDAESKSAYLAC